MKAITTLLILIALSLSVVSAQNEATPEVTPEPQAPLVITYGETVTGRLIPQERESQEWQFQATEGDFVSINMTAVADDFSLDPYLEIIAPDGTTLDQDDDSGGNFNAFIELLRIPTTGTYVIIATSFGGSNQGDYTLSLTQGLGTAQGDLTLGESRTATLNQDTHSYRLSLNAGTLLNISVDAAPNSSLDPYVVLFSPDGTRLEEDDDSGSLLNALISTFSVPSDGVYYVIVQSYLDSGEGEYVISTSEGFLGEMRGRLTVNSNIRQVLVGGSDVYTFYGMQGMTVSVYMIAEGDFFDPMLRLYDPNALLVSENDDYGLGYNAAIINFVLPATGTYTLIATSYDSSVGGAYNLLVQVEP